MTAEPSNRTAYLTAPPEIETLPGGIPYIVGNEAAERFSFYGMKAILVVFMTKWMLNSAGAFLARSRRRVRRARRVTGARPAMRVIGAARWKR